MDPDTSMFVAYQIAKTSACLLCALFFAGLAVWVAHAERIRRLYGPPPSRLERTRYRRAQGVAIGFVLLALVPLLVGCQSPAPDPMPPVGVYGNDNWDETPEVIR